MADMKKKKKYYVSNEERIMMDWKSWADKYFPVESKLLQLERKRALGSDGENVNNNR